MGSTRLVHFFYDWSLPANLHGAIIIGINRNSAVSRQRSALSLAAEKSLKSCGQLIAGSSINRNLCAWLVQVRMRGSLLRGSLGRWRLNGTAEGASLTAVCGSHFFAPWLMCVLALTYSALEVLYWKKGGT